MYCRLRRIVTPFIVLGVWCGGPAVAAGQVVLGRARAEDGPAVAGALVLALDSLNRIQASDVTDDQGRFALELPRSGQWTIRVEGLGLGVAEVQVWVSQQDTVEVEVSVPISPLAITGIEARSAARCPETSRDVRVAGLWQEARLVLSESTGRQNRRARFRIVEEIYDYAAVTPAEARDSIEARFPEGLGGYSVARSDTAWVEGPVAWANPEPELLLDEGFIRSLVPDSVEAYLYEFFAPDPAVILSDRFLAEHCFFLVEDPDRRGWVGLGFTPTPQASLEYDVEGVFWLPQASGRLPFIEFKYTTLPRLEELRLPDWLADPGFYPAWPSLRLDDRFLNRLDLSYVEGFGWLVHKVVMNWPAPIRFTVDMVTPDGRERYRRGEGLRPGDYYRPEIWMVEVIRQWRMEVLRVQLEGSG